MLYQVLTVWPVNAAHVLGLFGTRRGLLKLPESSPQMTTMSFTGASWRWTRPDVSVAISVIVVHTAVERSLKCESSPETVMQLSVAV